MVLTFIPLALLLGAAPLAAQVPTRAPTRSTIPVDSLLHPQGHPGWFGFRQDVGRDSLVVLEVAPGSPAERAGLRKGDRITMLDNRIATPQLLHENPPMVGDMRRITVRRGSDTLTFAMVAVSPPPGVLLPTRAALANADTVAREARQLRGQMALKATRGTNVMPAGTDPLIVIDGMIVDQKMRELLADSSALWRPSLRELLADSHALGRPSRMVFDSLLDPATARIVDSPALYAELVRSMQQTNDLLTTLAPRENAVAGAEFEHLNPGLADYFGGVTEGVFVLRVAEATPAATAGLRPGDIVQTVNGRRVPTILALRDAVTEASGTITLRVLRKAKPVTVVLRKQ